MNEIWAAAGFVDTLFRAMMLNEVSMVRRSFSREFKLEAVKLVEERRASVTQAAKDLGLPQSVLGLWVREANTDPKQAFPGRAQMKPDEVRATGHPRW